MTIREMIAELEQYNPDWLVVRQSAGDKRAIYYERGSNWDCVQIQQERSALAKGMWFGCNSSRDEFPNSTVKMAVVI